MKTPDNKRRDLNRYRRRKNIRKLIGLVFMVFLCLYIPVLLIIATTSKPQWEFLSYGTIKDSIEVSGLILKDEQVYVSGYDGMLQKNAMEGQRVPAGHVVASIVNRQYMDVFHEIQYLGNEILLLKKNSGETSGIFTRDLKKINDDIIVLVSDIAGGLVQGDLSGFGFALANIQRNARMRNDIMVGAPTRHD
ncbi:MAG: HlyD family efflux transporter periplasmic adaptor subunit [Clostridia bacterium]